VSVVPGEPASVVTPATASEPPPPCSVDVITLGLKGSTPEQLETRFGPPAVRRSFRAVGKQGELYGPIETLYPSIDPRNHDVPLQEWAWKSGACTLTLWFHHPGDAWLAIDDVHWHADIDF
jgi:hypothetical protein